MGLKRIAAGCTTGGNHVRKAAPRTLAIAFMLLASPATAQGEAPTTTAVRCADTDILLQRARVRLLLRRTTETAALKAKSLLDTALAQCAQGRLREAASTIEQALSTANDGQIATPHGDAAAQQTGAPVADGASPTAHPPAPRSEPDEPQRAWWRFWN